MWRSFVYSDSGVRIGQDLATSAGVFGSVMLCIERNVMLHMKGIPCISGYKRTTVEMGHTDEDQHRGEGEESELRETHHDRFGFQLAFRKNVRSRRSL